MAWFVSNNRWISSGFQLTLSRPLFSEISIHAVISCKIYSLVSYFCIVGVCQKFILFNHSTHPTIGLSTLVPPALSMFVMCLFFYHFCSTLFVYPSSDVSFSNQARVPVLHPLSPHFQIYLFSLSIFVLAFKINNMADVQNSFHVTYLTRYVFQLPDFVCKRLLQIHLITR